jgi:hypothetical protein
MFVWSFGRYSEQVRTGWRTIDKWNLQETFHKVPTITYRLSFAVACSHYTWDPTPTPKLHLLLWYLHGLARHLLQWSGSSSICIQTDFMVWHQEVKRPLFMGNALLRKVLTSGCGEDESRMMRGGDINYIGVRWNITAISCSSHILL